MEVTKENFHSVMIRMPEALKAARFITIDTEFTGLRLPGLCSTSEFDTPETLYRKQKNMIESFMAIQYGIVMYYYDDSSDKLSYEAYNFYVYPSEMCSDMSFTCQASSLRFLAESGFDFNKLLLFGIPFLREKELNKLMAANDEKYQRDLNVDNQNIVIDNHGKQELLRPEIHNIMLEIADALGAKRKEKIEIPRFNSFLRRLIYKGFHQKFRSKVFLTTNEDETMTAHVGLTLAEYQEQVKQKYMSKKSSIEDNIGFSHVIEMIIQSKKLIVGHNMLLDLMFTINQFLQPLPPTLKEFMQLVQVLFPNIIDTKYVASTSDVRNLTDSNLYSLHSYVKKVHAIPKLLPLHGTVGFGLDDIVTHQASFDAFLTGQCFLALCSILADDGYREFLKSVLESSPMAFALNKISIRKLHDAPNFIHLKGEIPDPDRSNVFHLKFPAEWKKDDIMKIFNSCGPIRVAWLSDTTAYLCFDPKYLPQVKELVGTHPNHVLTPFRSYSQS